MNSRKGKATLLQDISHWLPGARDKRNWMKGIHGYFEGSDGSILCLDFGGVYDLYICSNSSYYILKMHFIICKVYFNKTWRGKINKPGGLSPNSVIISYIPFTHLNSQKTRTLISCVPGITFALRTSLRSHSLSLTWHLLVTTTTLWAQIILESRI